MLLLYESTCWVRGMKILKIFVEAYKQEHLFKFEEIEDGIEEMFSYFRIQFWECWSLILKQKRKEKKWHISFIH